jgi:hypothetical protein
MIIANGTIEIKMKRPWGLDEETGHPVARPSSWGCPIPCQIVPIGHDYRTVASGEHYTQESYMVLVEEQPFCLCGEQVRLKDFCGNICIERSVVSVEWLEAVCQTKVTI